MKKMRKILVVVVLVVGVFASNIVLADDHDPGPKTCAIGVGDYNYSYMMK